MSLVKAGRDAVESLPLRTQEKISWPDVPNNRIHHLEFWLYENPYKAVSLTLLGISKPRSKGSQDCVAVFSKREHNSWRAAALPSIEDLKLCGWAVLLRPNNEIERKKHWGLQLAVILLGPASGRPHSQILSLVSTPHIAHFTPTIC